ncbi:zinc finger protein 628-like [Pollicipes pollicipes]|uniref:zinc finger protein 628-like n=1 Tax=Pollicipes pollicipes TaxID=41117 RepID=UPI001884B795|nr:zinc finger protein 628-like [Pollicipes pollicipes]
MESWLTEALDGAGAGSTLEAAGGADPELALLQDPSQLQLDFSVPLELLYDQVTAFRCRICQSLQSSHAAITDHIELRHCQPKKKRERRPPQKLRHDKRFQCRVDKCSLRFTCEQYRSVHEKCHEDVKSFKCCQCAEFATGSWVRVMTHMWRQHGVDLDLYACDKCHFKSALFSNLENHRLLHVSERRFVCTECNKGFRQMSQLLNHRVVHSDGSRLAVPKWFRPHVCPTCSKMFSSVKTLKIHQRILHDKVRSFCCRVCSHTSATKALLQLHMRGHSGETPFVCPEPTCDYKTRDPSSFRRHKMRHSGVRPYRCPHCDYQCIQSSAIKSHVINRHGGRGVFRCHLCNFCTVNEITYGLHVSDHQKGLIAEDCHLVNGIIGAPAPPPSAGGDGPVP